MPSQSFEAFLASSFPERLNVLDSSLSLQDYHPINLSIYNQDLSNLNVSSSEELDDYIFSQIRNSNCVVGYGGYQEERAIYQRSNHFNEAQTGPERNIHLGMDLWIEENTAIFSPLVGRVHSFNNNKQYGDYGPTIVLEHTVNDRSFHALYGHLSLKSIQNINLGDIINQGEQFATLGSHKVNGDYPPHLHFQIIDNMGDWSGDYPGVCSKVDLDYYALNCPDPNLLLKIH